MVPDNNKLGIPKYTLDVEKIMNNERSFLLENIYLIL